MYVCSSTAMRVKSERVEPSLADRAQARYHQLLRDLSSMHSHAFPTLSPGGPSPLYLPSADVRTLFPSHLGTPACPIVKCALVRGPAVFGDTQWEAAWIDILRHEFTRGPCQSQSALHVPTEVFIIPDTDPRVALRGKRGLRVTADGKRHQLIGPYGGLLVFDEESALFGPLRKLEFSTYSVSFGTMVDGRRLLCTSAGDSGRNTKFINAYQRDPTRTYGSVAEEKADKKRQNCACCELIVNDQWPVMFAFLTRAVTAGTELLIDYGPEYWPNMQSAINEDAALRAALKACCDPVVID